MNPGPADYLSCLRAGCQRLRTTSARWLVAVSGGADSVALLRGLVQLQPEFDWELVVGHFDHRWRGAESAADAAWVRDLAATLRLPSTIGAADITAVGASFDEDSARRQRYEFLEQAALQMECEVIATGHTADDQAETVLHHLLRGTGVAGLRGISSERATAQGRTLVRPMLGITREQVLAYLQHQGQDFRTDRTNADLKLTRNWLRNSIVPELQQRIPHATKSLCRLAEQAEELAATLSQLASELLDRALVDAESDVVRLDVTPLIDRPRHLVRQAFVELWRRRGWPLQAMGYDQWNRLADLVHTDDVCMLPGAIEARRRGHLLVFQRVDAD